MNITYQQAIELGGPLAEAARRAMGERRAKDEGDIPFVDVIAAYQACGAKPPHQPMTGMNKTERRFWENVLPHVRQVVYEGLKFRLAGNTTYRPDFVVWLYPSPSVPICVEIKGRGGFAYDDAKVKIKVAAELYPGFRWLMAWPKAGGWDVRPVTDRGIGRERIAVSWIPGS